ncbi:MAG: phospholipase D-like domain-containing protein [Byssovorax sp.]
MNGLLSPGAFAASAAPFAELQVGAHRLALLKDGAQAYPAMLAAIEGARRSICFETFIFRSDRAGTWFAEALAARARAGVEVSFLYDAWGSSIAGSTLDLLHAAGVRTLAFRPLRFFGRSRAFVERMIRRDHKKTLVVDSRVGFTGGINVCDDYMPEVGLGWRDTHMRLEGPAALDLERFFLRTWRRAGGAPFEPSLHPDRERLADTQVSILTSDRRRGRSSIREAYRRAFAQAREQILVTNAYFLPEVRLLQALVGAARRGVDVRVMVPGTSDVPTMIYASRAIYGVLLEAGVRMFEWKGRVLHAKTAVIDGRWSTVGSSNLDQQSLRNNLEANAIIHDAGFARALIAMFDDDLGHCEEIDRDRWQRRGAVEKTISWGAYLLRKWL